MQRQVGFRRLWRMRAYARSTYGHANLYGLFTDAGLRYAKRRGVVAYVMPTSDTAHTVRMSSPPEPEYIP